MATLAFDLHSDYVGRNNVGVPTSHRVPASPHPRAVAVHPRVTGGAVYPSTHRESNALLTQSGTGNGIVAFWLNWITVFLNDTNNFDIYTTQGCFCFLCNFGGSFEQEIY